VPSGSKRHGAAPCIASGVAIAAFALGTSAARADGSAGPVSYPNGDVATATTKCGPGELCATIILPGGDQIKVLTGGSGRCNPYIMTFMRYRKDALDAVWSTPTDRNPDASSGGFAVSGSCGAFRKTHMLIDGIVDMGVFQNKDGTVFVQFFGGSPGAAKTAGA
jgi:hypothetical protein